MELVIKISQETYNNLKIGCTQRVSDDEIIEALKNGTPLPKGHGDLIDRKELLKQPMDKANYPSNYVRIADAIIEADKEYEVKVVTRGNCMICGKELTEGLFFCKECEDKEVKE